VCECVRVRVSMLTFVPYVAFPFFFYTFCFWRDAFLCVLKDIWFFFCYFCVRNVVKIAYTPNTSICSLSQHNLGEIVVLVSSELSSTFGKTSFSVYIKKLFFKTFF